MELIHTHSAPAAIGPYSQAMVHNGLLFSSGQIGLVPETSEMILGGIGAQTEQCLKNLKAVLEAGGAEVASIVKVVIFLKDMNDFAVVNKYYELFLGQHRPARSTVAVAGLPRGALVEIECVAVVA
jgi:2-iminobutanoate/2-iminopropanoate deaminase